MAEGRKSVNNAKIGAAIIEGMDAINASASAIRKCAAEALAADKIKIKGRGANCTAKKSIGI